MSIVLDASAILAVVFDEPGAERVSEAMLQGAVLSSVNLAEVASKLVDQGYSQEDLEATMRTLRLAHAPFGEPLAVASGLLRAATRSRGLSLGDRACLALAIERGATAMTADRGWEGLDVGVAIEVIR